MDGWTAYRSRFSTSSPLSTKRKRSWVDPGGWEREKGTERERSRETKREALQLEALGEAGAQGHSLKSRGQWGKAAGWAGLTGRGQACRRNWDPGWLAAGCRLHPKITHPSHCARGAGLHASLAWLACSWVLLVPLVPCFFPWRSQIRGQGALRIDQPPARQPVGQWGRMGSSRGSAMRPSPSLPTGASSAACTHSQTGQVCAREPS